MGICNVSLSALSSLQAVFVSLQAVFVPDGRALALDVWLSGAGPFRLF